MTAALVPAQAAASVTVVHVGQVTAQDVAPQPGSEPDTVVEPDVAVSPLNPQIAVAASHDGRYPDGGAVGISYAWTHDGGRSWHHQPVPHLTSSTGGSAVWVRASDPVVAFGPDGDVYISTLLIASTCPSAVAVSRSTDGGRTFAAPVLAHYSATCDVSDDKNTLVVDTSATSPHRGRIYQFWTPFLTDPFGNADGSPQAMVYSDNHGQTWSSPVAVSAPHANTQNSTAMVQPDGTVVDAYIDYGAQAQEDEDTAFRDHDASDAQARARAAVAGGPFIRTAISTNGGRNFHNGGVVTHDFGGGPIGIRCCLDAATVDPTNGRLYVAWNSIDLKLVKVSSSTDGRHWGAPVTVNQPAATRWGVNVDVAALGGTVAVSYGLTNAATKGARFAQQYVAVSRDNASTFATTVGVGPRSNYAYAAEAGGIFPGDYIGTSFGRDGRLYAVWCVSSKPADPAAKYHQVVYGAVLTT
jgi:BNR/Asp-box repeat